MTANRLAFQLSKELIPRLRNLYRQTDLGKIDCLSEVAGIGDYHAALDQSVKRETPAGGYSILSVDALITAKEATGRDRDIATVKFLRAIREKNQSP